jgi:GNAT superfamily N-acetyltransferase
MHIQPVRTRAELNAFVHLPYQLYRGDPMWVPPLRHDQHGQFDPKRNPMLDHCGFALFLLLDDRKTIGRVAAFIDTLAIDFWKEPIGLFGYYECIPDLSASRILLEAAASWLRERGMKVMRGPWTFVSQEWGLVIEGFKPPPVVMAPYNPPYYGEQLSAFGLDKVKDLLAYSISAREGYRIPDRILTLTDAVARRYDIRVRHIDMRHYERDVHILMDMSNQSITGNWGYSPVTQAEAEAMARDMKPIVQPKGVLLAEDARGRPVGFAIALPDVNRLIKGMNGRLLPLGWLKLLLRLPRLRSYRMFALGVIPEYHGKGIDSLMYRALYESLYTPDVWMEINYVLEDNVSMNNAIAKLGATPLRRYRIYERDI